MQYNIGDIVTYGLYDKAHYKVINVNNKGTPDKVQKLGTFEFFSDNWDIKHFRLVKPPKTKEEILYDKIQYLKEKQDALQRM